MDIVILHFLLEVVIVIIIFQYMGQLNIMGGRKTQHSGAGHVTQHLGGGRDPLHRVGSPQHLVHKAEDTRLALGPDLIHDPL